MESVFLDRGTANEVSGGVGAGSVWFVGAVVCNGGDGGTGFDWAQGMDPEWLSR
jgi:hypothetical protein